MPTQILMPELSRTVRENRVAKWLKKEGERIVVGDALCEVGADREMMKVEAVQEGVLGRILAPEMGAPVPVDTPIALLLVNGENAEVLHEHATSHGSLQRKTANASGFRSAASGFRSAGLPTADLPTADLPTADPPTADPATADGKAARSRAATSVAPASGFRSAGLPTADLPTADPPTADPADGRFRAEGSKKPSSTATSVAPALNAAGPADEKAAGSRAATAQQRVRQSVREALRDAMAEEMRRDSSVFLLGEEVAQYQGAYKVSQGLLQEFGAHRVVDTPISEHGFAGLAIGAALHGLRPIVEFMTFNFAMQAMDQIINSAAKTCYMSGGKVHCPIVFRGPNGAAARVAAQHSQCYASWYAHIPGLKVVAPWSAEDAKGLLKSAIRDPNPVIFLEHELLYGQQFEVPIDPDRTLPLGLAKVVRRGRDATVAAFSMMVDKALKAATLLEKEGISVEVVDLRTLRPLDTQTLQTSIRRTNRLVVCEEGWGVCGLGAEIAAQAMESAFDWLDAPVQRVHAVDVPLPYADNLETLALPQVEDIVRAVRTVCS